MQTRRFPRTMQQAFGPYTSHQLEEQEYTHRGPLWTPIRIAFALTYMAAFVVLWWVL